MTSLILLIVLGAKLDVKVEGEGYLRFAHDGRIVYAKSAELTVIEGRIGTASGASLMPMMLAPANIQRLEANPDGRITAVLATERKELGRITFAMFGSAESLSKQGEFMLAKSRPRLEFPGEGGSGKLVASGSSGAANIVIAEGSKTTSASNLAKIVFPASIELDGGRMTLDRFAKDAPASLIEKLKAADFGPIPSPGFPTKITRARILAKMQYAGINGSAYRIEIPELIEVSAAGQVIEGKSFVEAALTGITEKLGYVVELKLEGESLPFTTLKGDVELKMESVLQRDKAILATVAIYIDGRRINAKQLTFTGEQVAIVIKANELVKVIMRANGVAIETTGRAKKAGRMGEAIEVEIALSDSNSKSTHLGTVKGPGLVEVKI